MPLAGDLGEFAIGVLDGLWLAMQELATDHTFEVRLCDIAAFVECSPLLFGA
jgi:hypothetical protein